VDGYSGRGRLVLLINPRPAGTGLLAVACAAVFSPLIEKGLGLVVTGFTLALEKIMNTIPPPEVATRWVWAMGLLILTAAAP
jgi:hypothetical protein